MMADGTASRKRLKCPACYAVEYEDEISAFGGDDGKCPVCADCGVELIPLCASDHKCTCISTIHQGTAYCPKCGQPMCTECGSHDVNVVSRVTGYLSDVTGWNRGKQQELKDRHRVSIDNGIPT